MDSRLPVAVVAALLSEFQDDRFGPQPKQFRGQRGGFGRRHPANPAAQQDAGFAFVGREDIDTLEKVGAWAITEPGSGSDAFGSMKSTARRDGDEYLLNGSKTFISNGQLCDLCIVAANTGGDDPHRAISLFVVEAGRAGS